MEEVIGGIFATLVIAILVLFLLFHFGMLSWGNGKGTGDGDVKTETVTDESPVVKNEVEETTITIVVTQDQYSIDEQKVTLTQIRERVTDESATINVVLEDNYASTKAWDDIKTSLANWGVTPIEQ